MENEAKIERIKTLMENFGVTQSEFAKRISIDASNFSKHLTGKLPVSDSLINRIVADLGVSKEWLCTGKGYMFRPSDNDAHSHIRTLTLPSEAIIPEARNGAKVYGLDVTAGNLARDRMFTEDLVIGSIDVPFINPDCSIVKVSGDSMKPVINNGDMIAIREIKIPSLSSGGKSTSYCWKITAWSNIFVNTIIPIGLSYAVKTKNTTTSKSRKKKFAICSLSKTLYA